MALSLDLTLGLPCSNTGAGAGVFNRDLRSLVESDESSLAANNIIDFWDGMDYSFFALYDSPFATECFGNNVINGGGVDVPSGLNLELTLCCGNNKNYDTGCKGSGAGEEGTSTAISICSDNLSELLSAVEGGTSAVISVCSDNSSLLLSAVEGGTSAAISSPDANADDRRSSTRKRTSSGKGKQRSVRKKAEAWSIDEHHKFLEGYFIEGNRWTEIATKYVLTRNSKQVGSHAQKFFLKENQSKEKANKKQQAGPPSILEIRDLPSDYIPVSERENKEADDAFLITPPPVGASREVPPDKSRVYDSQVQVPDITNQQDPINTGTNSMVESFAAMRIKLEPGRTLPLELPNNH